jgi:hypothetical protein
LGFDKVRIISTIKNGAEARGEGINGAEHISESETLVAFINWRSSRSDQFSRDLSLGPTRSSSRRRRRRWCSMYDSDFWGVLSCCFKKEV